MGISLNPLEDLICVGSINDISSLLLMISEFVRTVQILHCITEIRWLSIGPLFSS